MRVYKDTPFELTFMPWELEPPRTTLMVVAKATFTLANGAPCTIADEQVPCLGEVPWDDGEPPSLRTETDYAVLKPKGEWYLVGTARSPGQQPVTVLPVKVRVGTLQKQVAVWGDRVWQRGVLGAKPSEPRPFTEMPLRWERSFGGPRIVDNPLGRGLTSIQTEDGPVDPLPNIEDPTRPMLARDDRPPPVGLFPIPSLWRARTAHIGTYDDHWKASRWPYFPEDFDFRFFNCAPLDQQLEEGYWRGDEEIELTGLSAEAKRISTRLPGLAPKFFIEWTTPRDPDATPLELLSRPELEALGAPRLQAVPLKLDTLVFDTDAGHVMCQWRGLIDVADVALSNVQRVFLVHEELDADHPHAHYERWLLDELLSEADEFSLDGDVPPDPPLESPALPDPALGDLGIALGDFSREMLGFLSKIAEDNPDPPLPDAAEVRKNYAALGLDADEVLPVVVPPIAVDLEQTPSYLRFVAILRRRLDKSFAGLDLSDAPYRGLDLSGADFSGAILTGADFTGANLRGATFDGASLARADLTRADVREASFVDADLSEMKAHQGWFDKAVFDGAAGTGAQLTESRFQECSFRGTELEACELSRCDFRGSTLDMADFVESVLDDTNFTASSMVDTSLETVHAHRAVFDRCRMHDLRGSDGADFSGARFVLVDALRAQFQGATLIETNFSGSNLAEADLSRARAHKVNLMRCVMKAAKLDWADLREAVLIQADFFEASFQEAILSGADARGAHFHTAHLWRAHTDGTLFEGAILDRTLLAGGND